MKRLWPRRFFYEWSQNLRRFWPIYIAGFFLFLAGVLAGIYTANSLAHTDKNTILFSIMGYAVAYQNGMRFLRLSLYRFLSLCGIVILSNSMILLPVTLLGFCISGAMWGVGMGCVFLSATSFSFVLLIPFFILLLLLHAMPHIYLFHKVLLRIQHTLKERRIAKSSADLFKEFIVHYQGCAGWFLFSIVACFLEAFLLPLFF